MKKPSVKTKCVANLYASNNERIIEFSDNGFGGLISFRRREDGKLMVQVYRLDDGIEVSVSYDNPDMSHKNSNTLKLQ